MDKTTVLETDNLTVNYSKDVEKSTLKNLNLTMHSNKITTIMGPNGCGKSTLLKCLNGYLKPTAGQVLLQGIDLKNISPKDLAKKIARLPQNISTPSGITVKELVSRGRYPYQNWINSWSEIDEEKTMQALKDTHLLSLQDLQLNTLSGGQIQRAWIAMILAQDAEIILLDEPTAFLDIEHSLDLLNLIANLKMNLNKTIVMVLHDINLALQYSDFLVIMDEGEILSNNTDPITTIENGTLQKAFRVDLELTTISASKIPYVIPFKRKII